MAGIIAAGWIYRCTIHNDMVISNSPSDRNAVPWGGKILENEENDMSSHFDLRGLEETLWQTVLETAEPAEIQPTGEQSLRGWITIGVQRLERQRRLAPEDLALAHGNLKKFVELMKKEAVFLGRPGQLDNVSFHAARRRIGREAFLTAFTLWPFWPHNFVTAR